MRSLKGLLCVAGLICATDSGGTLLAATTPQVIVVGEVVHGTLLADGPDLAFEFTAPSDGLLGVRLDWDPQQGSLRLHFMNDDAYAFGGTFDGWVNVVNAGQTYTLWVAHLFPCDSDGADEFDPPCDDGQPQLDIPFVLTAYVGLPPSAPPPPATPPPPPSVPGGCTIPDPFVSLGGGTCFSGDWWPPGLTPPGVNPPPPPPSPPPSSPAGCTIPNPFVSLGGGTCFNGDWWPPGLTPPGVSPNPPPAPAPPASPGGCTIPDPFVSLGGGTCVNGDWWPPGLLPPILSIVIR